MSGKRRRYTPGFREQAVRLVIETGRPVAHVAAGVGVGEQVLGRWVCRQRQAAAAGDTGAMDADGRAELEHLRRENAELRLDREFLKKAAAFFVSDIYRGVVTYVRVVDGTITPREKIAMMSTGATHELLEVGIVSPEPKATAGLGVGEVGNLITGVKDVRQAKVGDTAPPRAAAPPNR